MSFFEAILMGLVQGITEFLPVSSSGHLAILSNLLHIETDTGILFEVMLHMGTLSAIIFAFRTDIHHMVWEALRIFADLFYNLRTYIYNRFHETDERRYKKILHNNYRRFVTMLLVSTIPTAIIGYTMRGVVEIMTKSLMTVGLGLLITAVLLMVIDYWNFGNKIPKDITVRQALLIGICQGIGTFPGISRSGITITAGLLCGFKRNFAVRYSFLMSVPAIIGAMILELSEFSAPSMSWGLGGSYAAGMIVAAISGYLCIRAMLVLIQKKRFRIFAVYCLIVGIAAIVCNFVLV
ncbi:MAG: undecaprenyl-diphosphate phosphatase [Clostridia bacterium]|nr:undecaprenyl-diphosphate phosphatase [Clostridia bacterium]NCC43323.1 undecaprenyl-diphosphate phosphatase [Clostridia bacterium]